VTEAVDRKCIVCGGPVPEGKPVNTLCCSYRCATRRENQVKQERAYNKAFNDGVQAAIDCVKGTGPFKNKAAGLAIVTDILMWLERAKK